MAKTEEGIVVKTKADVIGDIGGYPVTNTMVGSVLWSIVLITLLVVAVKKLKLIPSKKQLSFEMMIQGIYDFVADTLQNDKVTRWAFPLIISLFMVILFFNLVKFIPGTESLFFKDYQLLKPIHKDLNMTLALSVVAVIFVQFVGIFSLGFFKYWSKFINFKKPLSIPLGLLELISEAAKMVSLSFRLFGNMLIGGILILLASQISHFLLPIPVLLFEVFIAVLQAGVFAVLVLMYIKLAIEEPH